ncbi:hypothetical protein [Paenibacillus sp. FSL R7-0337]|uniref:hypothetical protein n=1 Tax=Paenibacillus sp. FSL R7-0337 TaxID=1926588 RepID=UPI00096FA6C8|nr:hypothetical protein [Paenibacillus sp. FSL R7-0337]OMG01298.1 hypothetical protein BK147_02835 [Paenibacillus sp. FSL R7-0337]
MMKDKYVNGMDGIKADEAFKQSIIRSATIHSGTSKTSAWTFRRKIMTTVLSCVIILLIATLGPLLVNRGDPATPSPLYSGFMVTAYAADGVPVVVQPGVEFPLGQYSLYMSSVPGFPIKLAAEGADTIEVRATEGQLLLWNPADGKVILSNTKAIVKPGDTVYWSPPTDKSIQYTVSDSSLEITAFKGSTKLGSSSIQVLSQDHITYTGKLVSK